MTAEELRSNIVEGIDAILEAPWIVSRWISAEQRRILRAQRSFWQHDAGINLTKLLELVEKETPHKQDEPKFDDPIEKRPRSTTLQDVKRALDRIVDKVRGKKRKGWKP